MKKHLILSILLLLVVYNLIGFMAAFQVIRLEWRQSVRSELAKMSDTDLTRFVFAKNEIDTFEKEFRHKGKYYDIVRFEEIGDSLEIFCFDDAVESRLTAEFSDLIIEKTHQNTDYQHKTALCFQSLIKDFYFPLENNFKCTPSVFLLSRAVFDHKNRFLSSNFLSTDTPPPNAQVALAA
jgi:hypothetical protein